MRNVKSALAVFACLLLYSFFTWLHSTVPPYDNIPYKVLYFLMNRTNPIFACIAAIITMQGTIESSVKLGQNRLIGTAIGGVIGIAVLFIDNTLWNRSLNLLIVPLGIIIVIYLCNIVDRKKSVTIAAVTYLIIMVSLEQKSPYLYAVNRIIDTALGIGISVLVNMIVKSPEKIENETEN